MGRFVIANFVLLVSFPLVYPPPSVAQTSINATDSPEILVESFVISGTRSVGSVELARITSAIAGSRFDDDPEELKERIKAQFQNHGYFPAEIQKLDIKVIDPLGAPKPVRLEAQVSEGPLCKLSVVEFTGNHAITSKSLRARFPLKTGSDINRSKIAQGLRSIQKAYGALGYVNAVLIPDAKLDSSNTVRLDFAVEEGSQYRMDKLEVPGPKEVSERLQAAWTLQAGTVFDSAYIDTFLDKNADLLPAEFTRANGVALFLDCHDNTVSVHFHLTQDPQHEALDRTKHGIVQRRLAEILNSGRRG